MISPPVDLRATAISRLQGTMFGLPLFATCYTAGLAILLAQGAPVTTFVVILFELVILGWGILTIARTGLRQEDWPAITILYVFLLAAIVTSLLCSRPMIEVVRTGLIISIFAMLGHRMTLRTLDRLFLWSTIIVLAVLLLEIFFLAGYVTVFQPQAFFSATRGIQTSEFNELGLFNNATSFEGRFNFGVFSIPRTSSIFLEQISLGNFACVLAIYVAGRAPSLTRAKLSLHIGTIVLILITTNSRFGSLLVASMLLGYMIFPLMPRWTLPLASIGIFAVAAFINIHYPHQLSDDLIGRISYVGQRFREADLSFYLGMQAPEAIRYRDSGYTYMIGTMTLFGMIALWTFVNFFPRANDAPSRRVAWGVVIYFLGQLLVSSTSLLSIKTAALLWVLIGCIRVQAGPASHVAAPAFRRAIAA